MAVFAAGPYRIHWGNVSGTLYDMGVTEDGINLEWTKNGEEIRGDNYGEMIQDVIDRGVNAYFSYVGLQYDMIRAAVAAGLNTGYAGMLWPHESTDKSTVKFGDVLPAGSLAGASGDTVLICTPIGLSTATTHRPVITARRTTLAPGFPLGIAMQSRLRRMPFRWLCLPYIRTGTQVALFELQESGAIATPGAPFVN